jgi:hypothetical protein
MNMNDIARAVTKAEGGKTSVTIAQVKEVLKIIAAGMYANAEVFDAMIRYGSRLVKDEKTKAKKKKKVSK